MNTPHTPSPGPWIVDHLGQIIGPRDGCSHEIIAHMPAWFQLAKAGAHATQDHIVANARLIASAPQLLSQRNELREALQVMLRLHYDTGKASARGLEACARADAALANSKD